MKKQDRHPVRGLAGPDRRFAVPSDPLETGEELPLTLIRHVCRELEWQYDAGMCRIQAKLLAI